LRRHIRDDRSMPRNAHRARPEHRTAAAGLLR
jgi:hypothetical protein